MSLTKRALLSLRGSFACEREGRPPLVGLELGAYRIGEESPMLALEARGVLSPSVTSDGAAAGLLGAPAPAPFVAAVPDAPGAGED